MLPWHCEADVQPHTLLVQTNPLLCAVQSFPQLPQLVLLDASSQPSSADVDAGVLQFTWPRVQLEVHTPPEQASPCTFVVAHARVQEPQASGSVDRLLSQPLSAVGADGSVQSAHPAAQDGAHLLPLQTSGPLVLAPEHGRLQAPQWAGSVAVFDSQPSSAVGAAGWVQFA